MENRWYAQTRWYIGDVKCYKPDWTDTQCDQFPQGMERQLIDAISQAGNHAMETLSDDFDFPQDV